MGAGFKAVISTDFADIFRNNALKNGLLPDRRRFAIRSSSFSASRKKTQARRSASM